jgi:hypothetical protein
MPSFPRTLVGILPLCDADLLSPSPSTMSSPMTKQVPPSSRVGGTSMGPMIGIFPALMLITTAMMAPYSLLMTNPPSFLPLTLRRSLSPHQPHRSPTLTGTAPSTRSGQPAQRRCPTASGLTMAWSQSKSSSRGNARMMRLFQLSLT